MNFTKKVRQTVNYKPHTVTTHKHSSYPKAIRKQLGRKIKHRPTIIPTTHRPAYGISLTEREQAVLVGAARGEGSKEIAPHLGV